MEIKQALKSPKMNQEINSYRMNDKQNTYKFLRTEKNSFRAKQGNDKLQKSVKIDKTMKTNDKGDKNIDRLGDKSEKKNKLAKTHSKVM